MRLPFKKIIPFACMKILLLFILMPAASICMAKDVMLRWDANPEEELAGYKLYYKIGSPVVADDPAASVIDIPLTQIDRENPEFTVTELDSGLIYFFAVTAYDK